MLKLYYFIMIITFIQVLDIRTHQKCVIWRNVSYEFIKSKASSFTKATSSATDCDYLVRIGVKIQTTLHDIVCIEIEFKILKHV